jgi:hypothetical protein
VIEEEQLQEECSIPSSQLTPLLSQHAMMSDWIPPRKRTFQTEDTSDSIYTKRHIRHERSEKRIVNREKEQYLHTKYRQHVAAEQLKHLALNNRLTPTQSVSPPPTTRNVVTRSRRRRMETPIVMDEEQSHVRKRLRNRSELKVQTLRKLTHDGLLSEDTVTQMLSTKSVPLS